MGGRWVIVIFLLLGVWQIVGSLIEKAGKKQQAQRLRDLAAERERQLAARGKTAPATPTAPTSRTSTDRAETLAARRRAQLEQLRKRRSTRGTVGDLSAGPATQSSSAPMAGRHPVTFQPAGPAQAPGPRRPAPQAPPARPAPPRQPRRVPVPIAAPEPELAPIGVDSPTRRVVEDAETPPLAGRKSHLPPRPVLPDEPLGPHVLRQMVLFREILEPPVALRDRQVWDRL